MKKSNELFNTQILPNLETFGDFHKIIENYKPKQKGDFFEILTKYIFLFHHYYKNITKTIWLYSDITSDLLQKLNIPTKDKGIDLVLLTKDNKYYAIQSKFRTDKNQTITWSELGTFVGMTFGISDGFSGAFFVTNISTIDDQIEKSKKIVSVYGNFFDTLDKMFFEQLKKYILKSKIVIAKNSHTKRNYQTEFVDRCINHFKMNDRGFGNIACGVGKTLMSYWVWQQMNPKIALIGVPTLHLLTQFFKEWAYESTANGWEIQFLLIGSDAEIREEEYQNNGILLTTNETEIEDKLRYFMNLTNKNLVIITTYQSANKLSLAAGKLKITFNLGIIDEAHKTCQQKDSKFTFLLDDNNLKIDKRLFMTATPRIYKTIKQNDTDDTDDNIVSMDNEKWYGKEIYKYSIRQGIDAGFLCPYQIMTLFTEDAYIDTSIKENNIVKTGALENISSYYMATAIMIIKAFQNHDCNHLVTYHNTNANSKSFVKILTNLIKTFELDIVVLRMDGETTMKTRTSIINAFTGHPKCILASARILNEGVNVPVIDSVCFVDKRDSTIDITQCIGRALRLFPKKMLAKVIVPYVISNINGLTSNDYFPQLISIIKSLSESDEAIKEYFRFKNTDKVVGKMINSVSYLTNETTVLIAETVDINKWFDSIDLEIWKRIDSFDYYYNKLVEYLAANDGKYPSQVCKNPAGQKIGLWLAYIKQQKKSGKLSDSKIKQLEPLAGFKWETFSDFDTKFDELIEFMKINNRYPVAHSECRTEVLLAYWIMTQRKDKKLNKLTDYEIQKMISLPDFQWTVKFDYDEKLTELVKFVELNGKLPSTESKNEEESILGHWVERQRKAKKNNKINEEKIKKLEKVTGWYWEKTDPFDNNYKKLIDWITTNDNKIPSQSSINKEEARLGVFCGNIRKKYKMNKLDNEQMQLFQKIPNWFWETSAVIKTFDENLADLLTFIQITKRLPSSCSKNQDEKRLGGWCQRQKTQYKKNKLTDIQINQLNKITQWVWSS